MAEKQYKPGQFISINAPGKYRVSSNYEKGNICQMCDLFDKCVLEHIPDLFKNDKSCTETIGWNTYVVKVK